MLCRDCLHYRKGPGECRRNAPVPQGHRQVAHWPKVRADDGCGRFERAARRRLRSDAQSPPPAEG